MLLPRQPCRPRARSLRDHRRNGRSLRHVAVGRLGLHGRTVTALISPAGHVADIVFGPIPSTPTIH